MADDTIKVFSKDKPDEAIIPDPNKDQLYLKRSLDVDLMTIAFKFRSSATNLPRQLTTDFNGNIFLGYRIDRFQMRVSHTPVGYQKKYRHRGVTIGAFAGIGSTQVTPWTTNNQMQDEYNGFILSRGLAAMAGFRDYTFGLGIGWDYITDRDKNIWIYQNKPWYGVTIGLNIN